MNVWFTRLVLSFVVFCVTVLATILAARLLMPMAGHKFDLDLARKAGWALSPLFIFLYSRTWKKSDFQQTVAAAAPAPKTNLSLISKVKWGFGIAFAAWFFFSVIQSSLKDVQRTRQPGSDAFHQANLLIMGSKNGITHGNTPEAKEMAGELSSRLKVARQRGIEARKSAAIVSLTGGEFLTYCHLTDERCVFLVHVPDLRKFSVDAKDYIADAALSTAMDIAADSGVQPRTVAVGIRGVLAYDRALTANLSGGGKASLRSGSAKGDDDCKSLLQSHFSPPAAAKLASQAVAKPQSVATQIPAPVGK
jgi:hypothetical protein